MLLHEHQLLIISCCAQKQRRLGILIFILGYRRQVTQESKPSEVECSSQNTKTCFLLVPCILFCLPTLVLVFSLSFGSKGLQCLFETKHKTLLADTMHLKQLIQSFELSSSSNSTLILFTTPTVFVSEPDSTIYSFTSLGKKNVSGIMIIF